MRWSLDEVFMSLNAEINDYDLFYNGIQGVMIPMGGNHYSMCWNNICFDANNVREAVNAKFLNGKAIYEVLDEIDFYSEPATVSDVIRHFSGNTERDRKGTQ
jgi:hypothetical protein